MKGITDRQKEVLNYISEFTEENAYLFKWLYDKEEEKKYDFKTYMLKKGPLKR